MKLKIAVILGLSCLVLVCAAKPADEYENEDAPAPAPSTPKQSPRANLLNRRNQLGGRAASPKGSTTTTTTTTLAPDAELEDEQIDEEQPEEQAHLETSSTTETSRRLKGGIVRPFRSNQELLETLKKRREQAVSNKANSKAVHQEAQESAPVATEPEKPQKRPSTSSRGRYNKKETAAAPAEVEESSSTQSTRTNGARRFRN